MVCSWCVIGAHLVPAPPVSCVQVGLGGPLASTRSTFGTRLVTIGACLAHTWFVFGTHLVHAWHTPGTHFVSAWHTLGTHLAHIWCVFGTCLGHSWIRPSMGTQHCFQSRLPAGTPRRSRSRSRLKERRSRASLSLILLQSQLLLFPY